MNTIISQFPDLKPCYEKRITDKPTKHEVCLAIPKGKKYFGWFTYYLNNPIFFLVDINKKNIYYKYTSFNPILCNTVIYGTQFYYKSNETFCIEDVLLFQSKQVNFFSYKKKIELIHVIFKNLHCHQIEKICLMFGYPVYNSNIDELHNNNNIPYTVYCYQYRELNKLSPYLNYFIDNTNTTRHYNTFKITADNRRDIYKLECKDGFYGYATVCSIKTSKLLNSIFRNIKESTNLDLLEESDDDDDFENTSDNKYNLDNTVYMDCTFNKKFNSWEPVHISKHKKLLTSEEIKNLEII